MGVQFKNNTSSTLADAIGTSDLGITVAATEGANFPTLGVGDYFYLTLQDASGGYEIVKVTARTNDDMTIVRAQEGTNAFAFAAGSLCELRTTGQGIEDAVAEAGTRITDGTLLLEKIEDIGTQHVLGRNTSGSGEVEELTTSAVLDWIDNTQGAILYRGSGSWEALAPGSFGNVLASAGPGANPAWSTGNTVSNGDKGDIVVSGIFSDTWTIDAGAVSLAKMSNLNRYELIGRSSSGAGVPQAIATSAAIYAFLGSANDSAARTELGLGTIATQDDDDVDITGGSVTDLSALQGKMVAGTHTSGTLTAADANSYIAMTGNITLNGGVFAARDAILFYSGASSRTLTEGTSMTLRLGGTTTTGDRTLAARTLAVGVVIGTNEIVVSGNGVT